MLPADEIVFCIDPSSNVERTDLFLDVISKGHVLIMQIDLSIPLLSLPYSECVLTAVRRTYHACNTL